MTISLIASGTHGGGFGGPRPCGGPGVDVSAYSTLRLTLESTSANAAAFTTSTRAHLEVWLETSSDNTTWTHLHDFEPITTAAATRRVVLSTFDKYVRVGWHAWSMDAAVEHCFVWSLTGDAIPSGA